MKKSTLYLQLMRFDRPIGFLLLAYPVLWALWLSTYGKPSLKWIIIFLSGVVVMRAAGCVINDLIDRKFDIHVTRTSQRPLAQGILKPKEALILFGLLIFIALVLLSFLNHLAWLIAFILFILTILYPFSKRFFKIPQLIMGLTFNGVLMVFAEAQNHLSFKAWLLYFITVIWGIAYDTMYAKTDESDDRKLGLYSSAIFFGKKANALIAFFQSLFLSGLALMGFLYKLNVFFWLGLIIALGLCLYQQYLIRSSQKQNNFKAFLNNHWVGLSIFLGIFLNYHL